MRLAKALAVLALIVLPMTGCVGTSELNDDIAHAGAEISGRTATALDGPAGAVFATWNESSTEWPYYYAQIVDPWNWSHLVWRTFHTIWTVPVNPAYHVSEGAIADYDQWVSPVRETVAFNFTPAPHGGGQGLKYWASRSDAFVNHMVNAWGTIKYTLFNTNSYYPPYDRWYPEQLQGEKTTIHRTIDTFLFRYDWDDPYVN